MILRSLFAALPVALVVALCAAPRAARADGPGIAIGEDGRLHFFFESELRWDSLAGQGGIGQVGVPVEDPADFILHIRPGARFVEQGTTVQFTGTANIDYVDYTGWLAPTHDLSYLGANVQAALDVAKTGQVGLGVVENFSRSDHTSNPSLGIGSITDSNDIGARLAFRPGGGAIEAGLAYNFGVEAYELHAQGAFACNDPSCNGSDFGNFDSQTHRFAVDARWRFFPKTAIVFDSSFSIRHYGDDADNVSTMPFVVEAGLAGLLTEKIRVVVKAGYSNTFAAVGDNFSQPIGQVEFGWDPSETASITLGGARAAQPVSGSYGWYDDFRGYLNGRLQLFGRLQLTLTGNLDFINFANSDRQDTQAQAEAQASVEIFRMLHTAVGTVLTTRNSSLGGVFTYNRAEIYFRVNFTY